LRWRLPLLLVLSGALLGIESCEEEELHTLETERERLLSSTVAKQEFWDEVGRKGEAAKQLKALEQEIDRAKAELAQSRAGLAPVQQALANAQEVNARAEDVRRDAIAQRDALKVELAELDAKLARWSAP